MAIIMASQEQIGPVYAPTLVTAVVGGPSVNTFYNIDMLRRHCICLVRVHPDETVNLAHYTVREFLQSSYVAKSQSLRDFSLPEHKVNQIYFNTIMSVAAEFSGLPNIQNMREDPNGDPTDFRLYSLRRVRMGMFWNRGELASPPENKKLLMKLLDPYQPCYNGLQLLGSDGHSDGSNPAMFEWLPKFNPKADAVEKDAAYLTMLIGFNQPDLVKEFLRGKSDRDQAALFSTKMNVIFPVEWESFRKHGAYERKAKPVTVLEFYNEGHDRGFETDDEMNILRGALGMYLGKGPAPSKKGPSSTPTSGRKASLGSQSSSSTSTNKSTSGRSTPTVAKLPTISSSSSSSTSTGGGSTRPVGSRASSVNTTVNPSAASAPKSPRAAKSTNSTSTSTNTAASSSRDSTTTATTGGATRLTPPTTRTARSNSTSSNNGAQSANTSGNSTTSRTAAQSTPQAQQAPSRTTVKSTPTKTSTSTSTSTSASGGGGGGGRSGANTSTGKGNGTGTAGKDGVAR